MSDAVDRAKAASTLLALDALYDAARDAAAHTAPPDAAAAADAAAADDDKDDERTAYFQARALLLLQACDKHTSAASGRCRGSEYYTARQRLLLAKYGKVAGVDELLQAQERLLSPKNDDGAKPRGEEEQQQHAAQEEGASQGAEESQGGTTASEAILLAHSTPDDSSEGHSPRTSFVLPQFVITTHTKWRRRRLLPRERLSAATRSQKHRQRTRNGRTFG